MKPLRVVAVSGSPRAPSKSKTLAELMLGEFARAGCETALVDVAELPAGALVARESAAALDEALAAAGAAQIIVAASPTYRALYTGVMKALFDLMPHGHLAGKVCVPIQTAGSPSHFLAIEYGMRPLFASLDGVPVSGVYATDDQFADGQPNDKLRDRIATVAAQALALAMGLASAGSPLQATTRVAQPSPAARLDAPTGGAEPSPAARRDAPGASA